jgi:hypothetical protein
MDPTENIISNCSYQQDCKIPVTQLKTKIHKPQVLKVVYKDIKIGFLSRVLSNNVMTYDMP